MFVLGIQGSPRKNGNCEYLLSAFLKECETLGARTETIRPHTLDIGPCKELIVCEKKGFCPIRDEMEDLGYRKVKQADAVILATPVFFYGVSAQAKVFIDRCQMFWGRKYKLRLKDPDRHQRRGFLLSVAASAGKRLFEGVDLTTRYFYDAISTDYSGSLTYNKVEGAGDIKDQPNLDADIRSSATDLLAPLQNRRKLIFASPGNGARALQASAFAKEAAKGRIEVIAFGGAPPQVPDT
ncbi:MAG TPA: flavin reductase, partial [Desulfobacteraceae bacterium]|nr:flavin reductase [Desulfobacteraceae bacterium]